MSELVFEPTQHGLRKALVTGGAGFIGCNLVYYLTSRGTEVRILDNLSRPGSERNLHWLKSQAGGLLEVRREDVRDAKAVDQAVKNVDAVFHLAAQVAVTSSVNEPRYDFEVNTLGTLNVLEAVRKVNPHSILLFSSTNKVYGSMEDIATKDIGSRYAFRDLRYGVSETRGLDFHSPYGCSKGAADQYVRDYARIYGMRTVVFRQSCIYGPNQFGNEDQGWLAHFLISSVLGRPIRIYGDGKQVRDVLYIDDLVRAFMSAVQHIGKATGQVYNIGGGPENSVSVWSEFGGIVGELAGRSIPAEFGDWRPGDQPIYVSDIRKACQDLDWVPTTSLREGIRLLWEWVVENKMLFTSTPDVAT